MLAKVFTEAKTDRNGRRLFGTILPKSRLANRFGLAHMHQHH